MQRRVGGVFWVNSQVGIVCEGWVVDERVFGVLYENMGGFGECGLA